MMMIFEIVDLFVEPNDVECEVYDLSADKVIFKGMYDDMPYEIQNLEVCSIDNLYGRTVLTFNVESEG